MAKRKRYNNINTKGRRTTEPFVKLTHNLMDSAAWYDLSNGAVRIYIEVRRRYNGLNNGEISLSCREAGKVAHCGKSTANKYLNELVEHGFLRIAEKGLYTYRDATTWIITSEVWKDQPPTNDWKRYDST